MVKEKHGGLQNNEVISKQKRFGRNEIQKKTRVSGLKIFLSQFSSPLILILIGAAGVTWFLHDEVDTYVILAAVVVNTVLGFYQEYRAQRGLEALSSLLAPKAIVLRNDERVTIDAADLVPGDLVYLNAGERISADGVLVYAKNFLVNEAILTGESMPVHKKSMKNSEGFEEKVVEEKFVSVHDRDEDGGHESVYMGSTVSAGTAEMIVVRIGATTEIGMIASQLSETINEETPLQHKLKQLSIFLTVTVLIISAVIFGLGLWQGTDFEEIFSLSVAVAVSAIPEGLAVSLTAILAIGMQRILKRKALVRKLLAAEVLGSVSVICSDKTGTLTEGQMKVTKFYGDVEKLVQAALLGNRLNDPLEIGMWDWAKNHMSKTDLKGIEVDDFVREFPLQDSLPFDPNKRYAASLTKKGLFVVGAPEILLDFTDMKVKEIQGWRNSVSEMARDGLRVVGFGFKKAGELHRLSRKEVENNLHFVGLLAYEDPIRKGVAKALKEARKAGIDVKIITGDYKDTAVGVMKNLGWTIEEDQILSGEELDRMSGLELQRRVKQVVLFARTTPNQKLKIVEALQANGEVIAMTGDGVNDAPALKKSDIGVVVGTASDVSKETADIVLLDSNFSTIVSAVEEGRGIFDNLRKVVLYLLSNAFSEIIVVLVSLFAQWPLPITAAQILWINLVDDGFPNLALTIEPKEKDLLKRKPRGRNESILDMEMKVLIGLVSLTSSLVTMGIFWWYLGHNGESYARTMAFTTLAISTLLYVFSSRSLSVPVWKDNLFKNWWLLGAVFLGVLMQMAVIYVPFLSRAFGTVSLDWLDWLIVFGGGVVVMVVIEGVKWAFLHARMDKKLGYDLDLK